MDVKAIIADLESERDRINQAIAALQRTAGRFSTKKAAKRDRRRRPMSAERRERIGNAMKKRWAAKKAEKAA
jgi:hypothetical protein